MDGQDQRKNHFAGSESHGLHVCSKCGWPFANSHPSAKQRRAHKKICGKPKGYQRVDSGEGGSAHGVVSDDEHFSDEDYKTPNTSQRSKKIDADFTESTTKFVGLETDSGEIEDIKLESGQVYVIPFEVVSEKTKEIISDSVSIDGLIRSNKEHVDHANTSIDAAQTKTYEAPGTNFSTSINSIEDYNGNKEANENVIVLSVPGDVPVVDQVDLMVEDFEDHKGAKLHQSLLVDPCETIREEEGKLKLPIMRMVLIFTLEN
ncbi:uncharacterized protein LOC110807946 isoform X1 [Carica papaya]|uniref:uncharacterized protein LOC110807946 isoform X1 n=1 Tax=Carica papaya TaxID=3649 RepID=UPI000B8CC205|nr:uncharacterized protein LOC110807946 isoform X1 [Carica papaya]